MISFTNPTITIYTLPLQSSIKLSLHYQVVSLVDDYLLLLFVLMQITIVLFHSARQFLQQVFRFLQFLPALFFELISFLLTSLFLFFFHLLIVELATSLLGSNDILEEVMAVLCVEGDCGVTFNLFVEALLRLFVLLAHQL